METLEEKLSNRHGVRWSGLEDNYLLELLKKNNSLEEISKKTKRSEYAIQLRIGLLAERMEEEEVKEHNIKEEWIEKYKEKNKKKKNKLAIKDTINNLETIELLEKILKSYKENNNLLRELCSQQEEIVNNQIKIYKKIKSYKK